MTSRYAHITAPRTRRLLVALLAIPLFALAGCTPISLTLPPAAESTGAVSAQTPSAVPSEDPSENPNENPSESESSDDSVTPTEEEEPRPVPPPATPSTGPLNLSGYQGPATAKLLILGSETITVIATDGSTIAEWDLARTDIRTIVEGVTHALGFGPTIVSRAPFNWRYVWGGFTIIDYSAYPARPGDPPVKFVATVRGIGVTQFRTTDDIGVGSPASMATAVADDFSDGGGVYWAGVESYPIAVPGESGARILVEVIGVSGGGNVMEIRGPTAMW
jgi:hypothetical protein